MEKLYKNSRTWLEISSENLAHNVQEMRRLAGDDKILCPAVKGNAYGHGAVQVAPVMVEAGADWLAVDSLAEAFELRQSGGAGMDSVPIFIMGHIPEDELEFAVEAGFHFVLYNPESFARLRAIVANVRKKALTHLKLETGTNRQGVLEKDLAEWIERYKGAPDVSLEGVSTHFANIEDTTDHTYASKQFRKFGEMVERMREAGLDPKYQHCANSAATILFPETHYNFVRPGIANYGLWPSRETLISARAKGKEVDLRPVLSWKTKVAQIKEVPKGEGIAYGLTCKMRRDSRIAILPVGYFNGYRRANSGVSEVLIRGSRAPICGRVMMNMIVVDVTDIPDIALEDEVVLLGSQGDERVSAEELAEAQKTINYEITTQINPMDDRRVV